MKRPRHLSPDERELWDRVADRTTPLDPSKPPMAPPIAPLKPKAKKPAPKPAPIPKFAVGERAGVARKNDVLPGIAMRLSRAPVQMDAKAYGRMTKGKLKPEARLDLHGMTMAEAHPELIAFILGSQALDRRLVLVITGKGKLRDEGGPMPARQGLLRHQVPQWMALPPLAQAILQVTPAHLSHGGHGAYYVYLRRRR
mgnify:CR=1 FL=1